MTVTLNDTDLTDLTVPDLVVDIEAPPDVDSTGVSNNRIGLVGTAIWGPVDSVTTIGSWAAMKKMFGTVQNDTYNMSTFAYLGIQLGASHFRCVRVTDGTDTAASYELDDSSSVACITFTSKYTGTLGNSDSVTIADGTKADTYKVSISRSGLTPETFDNISGSGLTLWENIVDAINNGLSGGRGASELMVATVGTSTTAPTEGTYTLSGGTDGNDSITSALMVGDDGTDRTGMYALRGSGVAMFALCDLTDTDTWATQNTYAKSELCEAVGVSEAGDTISNFASNQTIDSAWFKAIMGDWAYWYDPINDIDRLVSPQAFYMGKKIAMGVENSVLNREIDLVIGTQSSENNETYSSDDLEILADACGDVICTPQPGGDYFGFRFGRNTSSSSTTHQDSYTTLVDYIALSLNKVCGKYIGKNMTSDEQTAAKATIENFLEGLAEEDYIGNSDDTTPYSVTITSGTAGTGIQKATVKVQFFDVTEYFIVDLTAGASVTISSTTSSSTD